MKSTEDIPRLRAVHSGERLVGYWGDQSGLAPKDRKVDPDPWPAGAGAGGEVGAARSNSRGFLASLPVM